MPRLFANLSCSVVFLTFFAAAAYSQDPREAVDALDMQEIARLATLAQTGTDPRVTASVREPSAEGLSGSLILPANLVLIEGEPAFVYVKEYSGNKTQGFKPDITFVMSCRGSGVVDISYSFFSSRPSQTDEEAVFDELLGQVTEFGRSVPAVMRLEPYDAGATYDMPVAFAFAHGRHGMINNQAQVKGKVGWIQVQLVGAANSNDRFFKELRGTGNLSARIRIGGKKVPLSSGVSLENFRTTAGPLLEHCQAGNDNPMDRELVPMPEASAPNALAEPPADLDLSFLGLSGSIYLQRIYQGRPADLDNPLHLRLTIPLAYHAAYSNVCGKKPDFAPDFVYTDLFGESMGIAVAPDDFASLLEATLIYEPVIRKLYDESVTKDYSFRDVLRIYQRSMESWKTDWEALLVRYGCTGEINDQFRRGVKSELPFMEYRQGSRNVLVDFGGSQYDIALSVSIDVETARKLGLAEFHSANDPIFTNTYPGQVLRAIAIGNFDRVPSIRSRFFSNAIDVIGEAVGVDPEDPVARLFKDGVDLGGLLSRESNVMAAYAVSRMHLLGSCGDPVTSYTQRTVYWTEYTNGLGPSESSSRSSYAEVPSKFDAIIKAHNNIETSWLLGGDMAIILGRMSCDSPARTQLEDNMIAYFNGLRPVHIAPLPFTQVAVAVPENRSQSENWRSFIAPCVASYKGTWIGENYSTAVQHCICVENLLDANGDPNVYASFLKDSSAAERSANIAGELKPMQARVKAAGARICEYEHIPGSLRVRQLEYMAQHPE